MGLFKKVKLHVGDKYILTMMQGAVTGIDISKDAHPAVRVVSALGGLTFGSFVGVLRLVSPNDIADSFFTPEKEMGERIDKKIKSMKEIGE